MSDKIKYFVRNPETGLVDYIITRTYEDGFERNYTLTLPDDAVPIVNKQAHIDALQSRFDVVVEFIDKLEVINEDPI